MSLLDQLSGVLKSAMGNDVSEQDAHQHYDQISSNVPRGQLGTAIGPAMSGLDSSEIQKRIASSASQMNPEQRGSFLQTLLGGLGGNLGGVLSQLGISPSVQSNPQSASPEDIGKVAAHAQTNSPDVFHKAMEFYSDHPTMVKALGTAVIAGIARHLTKAS